jgi:TRAP-type C4-dicarboxylate transport system permease small subunit
VNVMQRGGIKTHISSCFPPPSLSNKGVVMDSLRKRVLKVEAILLQALKWILFVMMAGMTLSVLLGVLFRYVLKDSLSWSEELARYLMIWIACLGAAVAYREGSHFAITLIIDKFHGTLQKTLTKIAEIMIFIFVGIVAVEGILLLHGLEGQTTPAIQIPMGIPYLIIPVACFIIVFEAVVMFLFCDRQPTTVQGEPK